MIDLNATGHDYDPNNPFTFCDKKTQITSELEHNLLGFGKKRAVSNQKQRRDGPPLSMKERLNRLVRNPKADHRVGQFRRIKNYSIDERSQSRAQSNHNIGNKTMLDMSMNNNNIFPSINKGLRSDRQMPGQKPTTNLSDANKNKLAMKDYLNFKRDIFQSKMNKKIKLESTNKLDEFIFYETKSLEVQINDMHLDKDYVNDYFYNLKKQLDDLINEQKELDNVKNVRNRKLQELKTRALKNDNETRAMSDTVKLYEDYRNFIKLVQGITKSQFKTKKGIFFVIKQQA